MTIKTKLVVDQIDTTNIEYAKVLDRAQREGFMVPHNDHMWRVTGQDWENFSRTEWGSPIYSPTGEPTPIFVPGPTVWVFTLERDTE